MSPPEPNEKQTELRQQASVGTAHSSDNTVAEGAARHNSSRSALNM